MSRPQPPAASSPRAVQAQRILATVDSVPRGCVATYGQIAEEAGLPRRARLVGKLLGDLPAHSSLPWHRILNARGEISARAGTGPRRQRRLLLAEGIAVDARGRVSLERWRWRPEEA